MKPLPLLLALGVSAPAAAQIPLEPGPHAVGFRVLEARDSTRAFRPSRDWTGEPTGDTSRPVRISLWYPAQPPPGGVPMRIGDFLVLARDEFAGRPPTTPEAVQSARDAFASLARAMGEPAGTADTLWDAPTASFPNATPVPGRHPVVLYFTSAGSANAGMAEYLASHGFVVASFPSNGRMTETSLEFTPNPLSLDTDVDDAGFVWSVVRRMPFVDADRLALLSFSSGSLAALLWQMRDMQAAAIVTLEGWERYRTGAEIVRASPLYDARRIRAPFLMLERAADEASPAYQRVPFVVDSLRSARLRRTAFRDAAHGDFLSLPLGRSDPDVFPAAARIVERFLSGVLLEDDDAAAALASMTPATAGTVFVTREREAAPAVPTEEELYRLAEVDPERAARVYRETRTAGPPLFRRHVLTRAAQFAATDADRVTILRIVVDAYPLSVDARFRLGEALIGDGRHGEGVAALGTALDLVADDATLDAEQRASWRRRIEERIAEIRSEAPGLLQWAGIDSAALRLTPVCRGSQPAPRGAPPASRHDRPPPA